ncbi:hypothetical protein BCR34DRAFT_562713 [Clohesyomyces aquaticus]|uniref:Uncharacterized protein n=1 Tax=Clohesyomyces aquaticus TaxID=1231657 RepID=A0A1Y1ZTE0_9PLEO|nr:hypothetical protein BCR34DRAFT_562713 [Clohesyomyces aquaticus]
MLTSESRSYYSSDDMQTPAVAGPFSLPLAKFSRADDAEVAVDKFKWRHATGPDLVVVFDTFRASETASGRPLQIMKVYQNTQVLETCDLESKINESLQIIEAMRSMNVQVRNEQLPISALVRCPLFAVRYTLPDGKIHRIQLKFASELEFDTAINHVRRLGLHITSSVPPPPSAKPASNPSAASTVNAASPSVAKTGPQTATEAHFLERRNIATPSLSLPNSQRSTTLPMQGQLRSLRDIRNIETSRPVSADSILRHGESNVLSNPKTHRHNPIDPPELFRRPATSLSDPHQSSSTTVSGEYKPQPIFSSPRTDFLSSSPNLPPIREEEMPPPSRPDTALLFGNQDTLSMVPPPRPEYCFGRPSSPPSSTSDNVSNNQQLGSVSESRPSSTSTRTSLRTLSLTRRSSSLAVDLPPLPQPTFVGEAQGVLGATPSSPQHPGNTPSYFNSMRPTSAPNKAANSARRTPPPTASSCLGSSGSDTARQERVVSQIRESLAGHTDDLAGYAMQSREGRRILLNDFMAQLIDDPNFLTLAEDVSTCWARIGLGME